MTGGLASRFKGDPQALVTPTQKQSGTIPPLIGKKRWTRLLLRSQPCRGLRPTFNNAKKTGSRDALDWRPQHKAGSTALKLELHPFRTGLERQYQLLGSSESSHNTGFTQ